MFVCGGAGVEGSADGRTAKVLARHGNFCIYWQPSHIQEVLFVCLGVATYMPNLKNYGEGSVALVGVL